MKSRMPFLMAALVCVALVSCSDDEDVKRKGDPDITHEGEKWTVASVDYTLIDQGLSGSSVNQTFKEGTKENAGFFYFVDGGEKGSFELSLEGYNKEDFFSYQITDGSISVFEISQSAGVTTNQNVVEFDGTATDTEITMSGAVTKQSMTGQFILTINNIVLKKQ